MASSNAPDAVYKQARNQMAKGRSQRIWITDGDSESIREMKMMRFIFSLPIISIDFLPENEQICALCERLYNSEWKINTTETAVILPCGHVIGHFCIREWLSPFEKGETRCPILECGAVFPCVVNKPLLGGQSIVGERLCPSPPQAIPDTDESYDAEDEDSEEETDKEDGEEEDEEEEDNGEGVDGRNEEEEANSVAMEEMINELANNAHASEIGERISTYQPGAFNPTPETDHAFDGARLGASVRGSSANLAEAAKSKTKPVGTWILLLRGAFRAIDSFALRNGYESLDDEDFAIKARDKL